MSITLLIIISTIIASLEALKIPSYLSVIADLVDKESLLNANVSNFIAIGTSGIIGPVLAGQLIKHLGMDSVYYLGSAIYILISLLLIKLAFTHDQPKPPVKENVFKAIKSGFFYLKNEKLLRLLIGMMVLSETFGWTHMPFMSVIARDFLGMESVGLGNLIGAGFGGMLITTSIVSFAGIKIRPDILAIIGFITFSTCLLFFAINTHVWLAFLLISVSYGLYAMFEAVAHTTIQSTVPSYMRGRIVSIQTTTWGLSALGGFPLGIIANKVGANYAIASSNAILLISGIILGVILIKSGRLKQLNQIGDQNIPKI
jgi:MFS family permease